MPLCAWPVPSSSQMVVLCSPIWHRGVDLAAQAHGGTRHRHPSSRDSWVRPSSGVGCSVSALLELLAKGLNLAAESIEREFVFRFYSLRWCRLISPEMGILGFVPGVFLQMPLSTLVQPLLDTDGRSWPPVGRELCGVGGGEGVGFWPWQGPLGNSHQPDPDQGPSQDHLKVIGQALQAARILTFRKR